MSLAEATRRTDAIDSADASDAELLRAAATQEHHGTAIAELHRRYADDVRAVCTNQLRRDPASIDDLVQETFLRLLIHAHTIHDPDRLIRWLRRTARHACHDHRRRAHHHREHPTTDHPLTHVEDFTDLLADRDRVQRLLTHMDQRHAHVLTAHYLHGLSITDIATRMRLTPGAVRTLLYRARQEGRRLIQTGKALLPLPLAGWLGRLGSGVKAGSTIPATMAALAPVIAATILVPALLSPTDAPGPTRTAPATGLAHAGATATTSSPATGQADPLGIPPAPTGIGAAAGPAGAPGDGPQSPPPPNGLQAPAPDVDLGVAGLERRPREPLEREVDIVTPDGTVLFGLGTDGMGLDPAFDAACTVDPLLDAVECSGTGQ